MIGSKRKTGAKNAGKPPALEFKGGMLTLMVLHVYTTEREQLAEQLDKKVVQAPTLFKNAPIILDLNKLQESDATPLDLPFLIERLRQHGLAPVGLRSARAEHQALAVQAGLALFPEGRAERAKRGEAPAPEPAPAPGPMLPPTKVVTQPVRSGQQIVALEGDLVVLSMVSRGAEILAGRNIYVYGPLRGRALAGVNGDAGARIICQNLDAELVAVAGHYQINEEISADLFGKPVQVYLEGEQLKIEVFGTA